MYLETMETAKAPETEADRAGNAGMGSLACEGAYSRKAYWRMANVGAVKRALTKD